MIPAMRLMMQYKLKGLNILNILSHTIMHVSGRILLSSVISVFLSNMDVALLCWVMLNKYP